MSQILQLSDYSNKSIVVRGKDVDATRTRKEKLKKLGGIYNPRLRIENNNISPGWIFPTKDKIKLQKYIDSVNSTSLEKEEANHNNKKHKHSFLDILEPQKAAKKRRIYKDSTNSYSYVFWFLIVYSIFTTTFFLLCQNTNILELILSQEQLTTNFESLKPTSSSVYSIVEDSKISNLICWTRNNLGWIHTYLD